MKLHKAILTVLLSAGIATVAEAQTTTYVSGFGGVGLRNDSSNTGALTSDFTTGAGTTIPAGTVLPAGTTLGWETGFDTGYGFGFAYGMAAASGFRAEIEGRYLRNNVDSHSDVRVGGNSVGSEDAGVLITGSGNLGVTVADVVADGQGHTDTWTFMGNAYYDFAPDAAVNPYVGGGVGYATTRVEFTPSGVAVASDRNGGVAYQAIAGIDFEAGNGWRIFAEYRYFATDNTDIDLSLLPGSLEIENRSHFVNGGVRFHF